MRHDGDYRSIWGKYPTPFWKFFSLNKGGYLQDHQTYTILTQEKSDFSSKMRHFGRLTSGCGGRYKLRHWPKISESAILALKKEGGYLLRGGGFTSNRTVTREKLDHSRGTFLYLTVVLVKKSWKYANFEINHIVGNTVKVLWTFSKEVRLIFFPLLNCSNVNN